MALLAANKWIFICFLGITVEFLTSTTGAVVNKRSGFGEFCNSTSKCNRSGWLTCRDGLCACAKVEEMLYDEVSAKCVSKAGERCKYEVDDGIYEKTDCVPDASCTNAGICICDTAFFESLDGNCLPQGNVGEVCLSDIGCRTDKFLKCLNGECNCEPNVSEPGTSSADGCVGLAGKPCLDSKCTMNAVCNMNNTCACPEEYFQNNNRKCQTKKSYLDTCTQDLECDSRDTYLQCWNGTCNCNPTSAKFWSASDYKRTGSKMSLADRLPSVVIEGTCIHRKTLSPGMIHTPNYPSTYDVDEDCSWLITSRVNSAIELTFLSFQTEAECDYVYVYDGSNINRNLLITASGRNIPESVRSTGNTMLVRFISDEDRSGRGFQAKYEETTVFEGCVGLANKPCINGHCVSNAACSDKGQCLCESEYSVTSSGSCGLSHGKPCNEVDVCSDSFACSEVKCTCKHSLHQTYEIGRDNCFSIVSGPCSCDTDCIQGASCKVNNKTLAGFCECNQGLVESVEGKCEIGHGHTCLHGSDVCDRLAGLKCVNSVCSCPDPSMAFNPRIRKCQGLTHFRCGKNKRDQHPCVDNTECVVSLEGLSGVCQCLGGFEETKERLCTEITREAMTADIQGTPVL